MSELPPCSWQRGGWEGKGSVVGGREEERLAKKECVKEQGRGEIGKVSTMRLGREVKERQKQITAGAFPVALGLDARARVPALLRVVVAHSSLGISNGNLLSTRRKSELMA